MPLKVRKIRRNSFTIVEFYDLAGCDFRYRTEPRRYLARVPSTDGPAFVCESNVGFTTRQLTNTQRCEPQPRHSSVGVDYCV